MKIFMKQQKDGSSKEELGVKLKILGAFQVVIGLACAVIGLTAIGIDHANIEQLTNENRTVEPYIIIGLDSVPVVSSVWITIAGLLPCCFICGSDFNIVRTKVIFMVFSILGVALFVPLMILTSIAAFILRGSHEVLLIVVVIVAVLEFFIGLVSSCFTCKSKWAFRKHEGKCKKEKGENYKENIQIESGEEHNSKEAEMEQPSSQL